MTSMFLHQWKDLPELALRLGLGVCPSPPSTPSPPPPPPPRPPLDVEDFRLLL